MPHYSQMPGSYDPRADAARLGDSIHIRHLDMLPRATYRRVGCDITAATAAWVVQTSPEFCLVSLRTDDGLLRSGLLVLVEAWAAIAPDVALRESGDA